jgi:hypothetical protein
MFVSFRVLFWVASVLLWCAGNVSFAQTLKEETRLFDKPSGAQQSPALPAGAAVKVLERQGFWLKVQVGNASGWAKASSIAFSSGMGGPIVIETGRTGSGNIVASSAARGLSAKDLMSGEPRMDEVEKLSKFAISDPKELSAFVSQGRVVALAQPIALKVLEPKASSPSNTSNAGGGSNAPQRQQKKKGDDDW